jgi:hypothetical protein
MDLSLVFVLATVVDLLALRLIPTRKRALRFVCMSALFTVQTILIVALIGSPFSPVFKVKDLPREFWLQLLACSWWALAARQMIGILALPAVLKKTPKENKILSDIIAACIYVCSGLAMMGFVFGLPLQGIVATSGVLAIVLIVAVDSRNEPEFATEILKGAAMACTAILEKPLPLVAEIVCQISSSARGA